MGRIRTPRSIYHVSLLEKFFNWLFCVDKGDEKVTLRDTGYIPYTITEKDRIEKSYSEMAIHYKKSQIGNYSGAIKNLLAKDNENRLIFEDGSIEYIPMQASFKAKEMFQRETQTNCRNCGANHFINDMCAYCLSFK